MDHEKWVTDKDNGHWTMDNGRHTRAFMERWTRHKVDGNIAFGISKMKATAYNERVNKRPIALAPPTVANSLDMPRQYNPPSNILPTVCLTHHNYGQWTMDHGPRTMGNGQKTTEIGQWTMDNTLAPLWNVEQGTRWTEI